MINDIKRNNTYLFRKGSSNDESDKTIGTSGFCKEPEKEYF